MAISEAEMSTAPVLLKESDIPEARLAGRKPAELGKANLLFWQWLSVIVKTRKKRWYHFLVIYNIKGNLLASTCSIIT